MPRVYPRRYLTISALSTKLPDDPGRSRLLGRPAGDQPATIVATNWPDGCALYILGTCVTPGGVVGPRLLPPTRVADNDCADLGCSISSKVDEISAVNLDVAG